MAQVDGSLLVNPTGTIDITAFDGHHVAATLELAGATMDKREVTVTGSLDYQCSDLSGCK